MKVYQIISSMKNFFLFIIYLNLSYGLLISGEKGVSNKGIALKPDIKAISLESSFAGSTKAQKYFRSNNQLDPKFLARRAGENFARSASKSTVPQEVKDVKPVQSKNSSSSVSAIIDAIKMQNEIGLEPLPGEQQPNSVLLGNNPLQKQISNAQLPPNESRGSLQLSDGNLQFSRDIDISASSGAISAGENASESNPLFEKSKSQDINELRGESSSGPGSSLIGFVGKALTGRLGQPQSEVVANLPEKANDVNVSNSKLEAKKPASPEQKSPSNQNDLIDTAVIETKGTDKDIAPETTAGKKEGADVTPKTENASSSPVSTRPVSVRNPIPRPAEASQPEIKASEIKKSELLQSLPTKNDILSHVNNPQFKGDIGRFARAIGHPEIFNATLTIDLNKVEVRNIVDFYTKKYNDQAKYGFKNLFDPYIDLARDLEALKDQQAKAYLKSNPNNAIMLAQKALDMMAPDSITMYSLISSPDAIKPFMENSIALPAAQELLNKVLLSNEISVYDAQVDAQQCIDAISGLLLNKEIKDSPLAKKIAHQYQILYLYIQSPLSIIKNEVNRLEGNKFPIPSKIASSKINPQVPEFITSYMTPSDIQSAVELQIQSDVKLQDDLNKRISSVAKSKVKEFESQTGTMVSNIQVIEKVLADLTKELNEHNLKNEVDPDNKIQNWSNKLSTLDDIKVVNDLVATLNDLIVDVDNNNFKKFVKQTEALQTSVKIIQDLLIGITKKDKQDILNNKIEDVSKKYVDYVMENEIDAQVREIDKNISLLENSTASDLEKIKTDIKNKISVNLTLTSDQYKTFYENVKNKLDIKQKNQADLEEMGSESADQVKLLWDKSANLKDDPYNTYLITKSLEALLNEKNVKSNASKKKDIQKILNEFNKKNNNEYPGAVPQVVASMNALSRRVVANLDWKYAEYNSDPIILCNLMIEGLESKMKYKYELLDLAESKVANLKAGKFILKSEPLVFLSENQVSFKMIDEELVNLKGITNMKDLKAAINAFNEHFEKNYQITMPKEKDIDFNTLKAYYKKYLDGIMEEIQIKLKQTNTYNVLKGARGASSFVYRNTIKTPYEATARTVKSIIGLPELRTPEEIKADAERFLYAQTNTLVTNVQRILAAGSFVLGVGKLMQMYTPWLNPLLKNYAAQSMAIQNNPNLSQSEKDKLQQQLNEEALGDVGDGLMHELAGVDLKTAQATDTSTLVQSIGINQMLKNIDPNADEYHYDPTNDPGSRLEKFKENYNSMVDAQNKAIEQKNAQQNYKYPAITNGGSGGTYPSLNQIMQEQQQYNNGNNLLTQYPYNQNSQNSQTGYNPYTSSPYKSGTQAPLTLPYSSSSSYTSRSPTSLMLPAA